MEESEKKVPWGEGEHTASGSATSPQRDTKPPVCSIPEQIPVASGSTQKLKPPPAALADEPPAYRNSFLKQPKPTRDDGYIPLSVEWAHLLNSKKPQPQPVPEQRPSEKSLIYMYHENTPDPMHSGNNHHHYHPQAQPSDSWEVPMERGSSYSMHETQKGPEKDWLNDERRRILREVDNAKFSRFHFRVCVVAGVGFFTDAYDIFAINIASTMIGYIYGGDQRKLSNSQDFGIKIATQVGTLFGQLVFGLIADKAGRKRMYGIELLIIIFCTLAQALSGSSENSPGTTHKPITIVASLIVWRLLMGIGIGGDYPLSAIITSEFAPVHIRGRLMAIVFSSQGLGQLFGTIVGMISIAGFRNNGDLDSAWRFLIGFGCVPAVIALYFRFTIPETPRFTMDIARNVAQATQDVETYLQHGRFIEDPDATIERVQAPKASPRDFFGYFSRAENWKLLLALSYSWFALDFAFYALTLNSSIILQAIHFGNPVSSALDTHSAFDSLMKIAEGNLILTAVGLFPGYIASILFIDRIGRKRLQFIGFGASVVIFVIMSAAFPAFSCGEDCSTSGAVSGPVIGFVFLYCLANFFQNFGPNTTTFIVPGEAFPTRYRSTAYGITAACGKLGAILAQGVVFATGLTGSGSDLGLSSKNAPSLRRLLAACAAVMATGLVSTWFIPETKNRTLEDISNEDQENFITGPPQPRQRYHE